MPLPVLSAETAQSLMISLLTLPGKKGKVEKLLNGRLIVETLHGLNPLDRLLVEATAPVSARNAFVMQVSNPIHALSLRALRPEAEVTCWNMDLYRVEQTNRLEKDNWIQGIRYLCQPSPAPFEAPDLIVTAFSADGEAGLALELLRSAREILSPGGKLLAAINNSHDQWLHKQLATLFGDVTLAATSSKAGRVYLVKRKAAEHRDADANKQLYVRETSVHWKNQDYGFSTCYGVFSSSHLDEGSRALLEVLDLPQPCRTMLDLGCGWGGMAVLAAQGTEIECMTLIDSNARAVEMARQNLERHGLTEKATIRLESNAESLSAPDQRGVYDVVITNPPYGTDFRVADLFVQISHRALRPGGSAWLVVKHNAHVAETVRRKFNNCEILHRRGYEIIMAKKA